MKTVNEQRAELVEQMEQGIIEARAALSDPANNMYYVVQNASMSRSGLAIQYDEYYCNPRAVGLSQCTYFTGRERAEVIARVTFDGADEAHKAVNLKVALLRFINEQRYLIQVLKNIK